jgi:hypothetical protein
MTITNFGATKPPAHPEDKTDDSSVLVLPNHQHTLKIKLMAHQFWCYQTTSTH